MRSLSLRQEQMLQFIREFLHRKGYPPSIRDIAQAVGISSTSVVDYNLRALERAGYIRRARDVSAASSSCPTSASRCPHGSSRCPSSAASPQVRRSRPSPSATKRFPLGADLATEGCYALQVRGKSMIEDLIDDGDLVVIRPQETANNGDIVVALLLDSEAPEGVATLKRFYRERDRVRLQPANSEMQPIYVDPAALRVQGKVVAVVRSLL